MSHHSLDLLDKKILQLISADARIPFLEVARICKVSSAAIHQRIQKLFNQGVLKGSRFILEPEKVGYETCAYVGLHLKDPSSSDKVAEALEEIPEVVECHVPTGHYDLFIHDKLQPLGLSGSETIISFNALIDRQVSVDKVVVKEEEA